MIITMEFFMRSVTFALSWLLAAGVLTGHLRLEPPDEFHAYFTGDSFFVTCIADETSGATRLTWEAPTGKDITHTRGRVHVEAAPHCPLGLELVVEEVRYKDQGTYTCSAIVDGKETTTHFTLKVY
ncbi:uncharacterized protein LOC118185873, partial [Stegodyphus dumicola]|uniref:uncharacterized protein LOC118185873 n=1 Tax=Stegodyphus dumicola TaxID=202533 RepID=UPI0015ADA092